MKKVYISSNCCGIDKEEGYSFTVENRGEMKIELSPLDVKHIMEALQKHNSDFKGKWEPQKYGWGHSPTRENRQIEYIMRKLYRAAKQQFTERQQYGGNDIFIEVQAEQD